MFLLEQPHLLLSTCTNSICRCNTIIFILIFRSISKVSHDAGGVFDINNLSIDLVDCSINKIICNICASIKYWEPFRLIIIITDRSGVPTRSNNRHNNNRSDHSWRWQCVCVQRGVSSFIRRYFQTNLLKCLSDKKIRIYTLYKASIRAVRFLAEFQ